MTYIHPVWPDIPDEKRMAEGLTLLHKAKGLADGNPRELAYIAATEAYYQNGLAGTEHSRLVDYDQGWQNVAEQYPDDLEAAAFYSLAHMAYAFSQMSVTPGDTQGFEELKRAGAMAEAVLAKNPDHPGAHHYAIHAYDMPGLAHKALDIARNFGSAEAWLTFHTGNKDEALATMYSAAALEASTYKHPVTPGEVLPARELLADMLLELNQAEAALAEYQKSLERTPNRSGY